MQKCNTTNGEFSYENIPDDTLALLTMTTGSTGKPKVALRTHADLFNQLQLIHSNLDSCTPDEIVLTTSYIYVFANILNGFTTVLPQLNLNASNKKICRILSRFSCIPITMIITSPDFCLKADNIFPALKTLYFGGAILNLNEAERILTKFQYSKNYVIYGSTECSIMCKIQLEKYVRILKQTGHAPLGSPVNGVDISLTDEGEITVSSCALLEEYLISDSRTKIKDENGTLRHRTGDMAQFENGYYYYLGKNKYFILRNNEKMYCNQLEQKIITALPLIPKCAVVEMQNRTFIVVEKCEISNDTDFKTNVRNACGIKDACIIKIRKIPCDIKHHTKINYEKLKKRLKKYDKL